MRGLRLSLLGLLAAGSWMAQAGPGTAETLLERGTYLMKGIVGCGNCHTPKFGPHVGKELAGGFPIGGPKAPFTAFTSNITPDKATGIGNWTDAQIVRGIRDGKRPDGSLIGPPMPIPLYRNLSDRDVNAIVAYLRQVKPVRNKVKKSEYRMPLPPAYGPPVGHVAEVSRMDKVAYGAYLAGPAGHCIECHTPMVRGRLQHDKIGAGGQRFPGPWGVVVSPNITPAGAVGGFTDRQIKNAITKGVRPDGSKYTGPMAFRYYANISEPDLDALVAYLRSLKPIAP